jgi:hypothetical protein
VASPRKGDDAVAAAAAASVNNNNSNDEDDEDKDDEDDEMVEEQQRHYQSLINKSLNVDPANMNNLNNTSKTSNTIVVNETLRNKSTNKSNVSFKLDEVPLGAGTGQRMPELRYAHHIKIEDIQRLGNDCFNLVSKLSPSVASEARVK